MHLAMGERVNGNIPQHATSQLLHSDENVMLHRLIGSKAQCLCMAVIQLFYTKPPEYAQWFKESAGVLCLVKDNKRREFVIRIYNMDTEYYTVIYEEDLHASMEYNEANNFLHTFLNKDKLLAFNFANNYEAHEMNANIQEKLQWLQNRLLKHMNPDLPSVTPRESVETNSLNQTKNLPLTSKLTANKAKVKINNRTKTRITKDDISSPSNFVHKLHYGINMEKNFKLEDCPEEFKSLLVNLKVTNAQLQDPGIREVIRNTLDDHQIPDKHQQQIKDTNIQKEIEREETYMVRYRTNQRDPQRPPSSPRSNFKENEKNRYQELSVPQERDGIRRLSTSGDVGIQIAVDQTELFSAINRRQSKEAPEKGAGTKQKHTQLPKRQPTLKNTRRPPALPRRNESEITTPQLKPKESITKSPAMVGRQLPPIPVGDNKNELKRNASHLNGSNHNSPRGPPPPTPNRNLSNSSRGPYAPPPPVISIAHAPPPPPPPPPSIQFDDSIHDNGDKSDGRSALFDAIKKGATLKSPDLTQSKAFPEGLTSSRNDLLSEIRKGKQLNPMQERKVNELVQDDSSSRHNDLAAALSKALKIRSTAIHSDDDTNDNIEESDDEWDA